MYMKETILKSAEEIHTLLSKFRKQTQFKFRGQSNVDFEFE